MRNIFSRRLSRCFHFQTPSPENGSSLAAAERHAARRLLPSCPLTSQPARSLSSDALVEFKPGEIGIASGIPEEHRRRKTKSYADNFKWKGPPESKAA